MMIVLDTHVVSEAMVNKPNSPVRNWMRQTPIATMAITSVTIAEIEYGLARLPEGKKKRDNLKDQFDDFLARGFVDRVFAFDEPAARIYASMAANRMSIGRPFDAFDIQIAAIARAHDCDVATRDEGGFSDLGVNIVNPWNVAP